LKQYECLYIVNSDIDGEGISRVTARIQEHLKNNGGEVANVQHWGKRKLAYMIEKQRYGNFVLMHFSGENPDMATFQHELEIDRDVLAYMSVRLEKFPDFDSLAVPQAFDTDRKRGMGQRRGGRYRDDERDEARPEVVESVEKPAAESPAEETEIAADAESATEAVDETAVPEETEVEATVEEADTAEETAPVEEAEAVEETVAETAPEDSEEEEPGMEAETSEATEEAVSEETPEEETPAAEEEPEADDAEKDGE